MSKNLSYLFILLVLSLFLFVTVKSSITGYSIFNSDFAGINLGYSAVILILAAILVILASEKGFEPTKEYKALKAAYQNKKYEKKYDTVADLVRYELKNTPLCAKSDHILDINIDIVKKGLVGLLKRIFTSDNIPPISINSPDIFRSEYIISINDKNYKGLAEGLAKKISEQIGEDRVSIKHRN